MMTLKTQALKIPFNQTFAHASASRAQTESILTTATVNGSTGYGEGCPRSYVTGETLESALAFHHTYAQALTSLNSLSELRAWVMEHRPQIDQNPAAWCALELALLDLFGCDRNRTVEQLLNLPQISGTFTYTAVIGLSPQAVFDAQVKQYQQAGLRDYKLKISGNLTKDRPKIEALQKLGRVRLDANNLWRCASDCMTYMQNIPGPIFAIEEPLAVKNFEALAQVSQAIQVPIILDESFLCIEDFEHLPVGDWIINLRISKMGGLLRSLAIAEVAQQRNIPLIVGAQVGETSLLSRAALTLVNAYRKNIITQEGAFSTYLLQQDPFWPAVKFGQGGGYEWQAQTVNRGFGLKAVISGVAL